MRARSSSSRNSRTLKGNSSGVSHQRMVIEGQAKMRELVIKASGMVNW